MTTIPLTRMTKAQLLAHIDGIESAPTKPRAKSDTFRTKSQREAGDGFPCTAQDACLRSDLRTKSGASSHEVSTEHGWHKAS